MQLHLKFFPWVDFEPSFVWHRIIGLLHDIFSHNWLVHRQHIGLLSPYHSKRRNNLLRWNIINHCILILQNFDSKHGITKTKAFWLNILFHFIDKISSDGFILEKSFECQLEHLPFLDQELSFWMTCESNAGLCSTYILAVVIADWKLRIRALLITVVHNADVTATKCWTFLGVVRDGELCQVQSEFFAHVQRENK